MKRSIIRCKHCNTFLESKHRHHFVTCECRKVSLDGGIDYQRILWPGGEPEDHFQVIQSPDEPSPASDATSSSETA